MKTRGDSSKEISNIGFVNGWAEVVGTERNMYTINYNLKNVFRLHKWPHVSLSLNHMHLRYDLDVDEHRLWSVFPLLSCPGLPSPPLCCAPQSGSSGMWWPRSGQSPAFMAPRPTLEVCDWEPWSQSGGWPESIHPSPVLSDTRCPPLHHHVTASRHISHTSLSAAFHFLYDFNSRWRSCGRYSRLRHGNICGDRVLPVNVS